MSHARAARRIEEQARKAEEKAAKEENRKQKELREYKHIMTEDNMVSNEEIRSKYASVEEMEDDFM